MTLALPRSITGGVTTGINRDQELVHQMLPAVVDVDPDASTNNTTDIQTALADVANLGGGIVELRPHASEYRADKLYVPDNCWLKIAQGARLRKIGTPSIYSQGLVNIIGAADAGVIIDGTIDGDRDSYTGGDGINGVYVQRSTGVRVQFGPAGLITGCTDSGVKVRNGADVFLTGKGKITDCWNNGVEWSFVASGSDSYTFGDHLSDEMGSYYNAGAVVPDYIGYGWEDLTIEDIQDATAAAGEGSGMAFGLSSGSTSNIVRGISGGRLRVRRANRGLHHESNTAGFYSWQAEFGDVEAEECRDTGVSLVGLWYPTLGLVKATDIGTAEALGEGADTAGFVLSDSVVGNVGATVARLDIVDNRASATDYCKYGIRLDGAADFALGGGVVFAGSAAAMQWTGCTGRGAVGPMVLKHVATPSGGVGFDISGDSNTVKAFFASLAIDHTTKVQNLAGLTGWRGIIEGQATA